MAMPFAPLVTANRASLSPWRATSIWRISPLRDGATIRQVVCAELPAIEYGGRRIVEVLDDRAVAQHTQRPEEDSAGPSTPLAGAAVQVLPPSALTMRCAGPSVTVSHVALSGDLWHVEYRAVADLRVAIRPPCPSSRSPEAAAP